MLKKTLNFFLTFSLTVIALHAFAQEPVDSTKTDFDALKQQEVFLDSMSWYVNQNMDYAVNLSDNIIREESDSVYIERIKKISTPISLTYNDIIRRWINLYINKNKRTPYLIGLSEYYFPIFENYLDKYDMPLELKYLPIIESALNPNAVSRAGATGLWQFMRGTGARFGLVNTSYVDERRDPEKSTLAAIRYLSYLYNDFNDWTLALAAYNCGEGNVKKAIRRSGGKTDYWEIYPYLPRETRGYVPAFIAAMYVMNYYDAHRIKPIKVEFDTNIDTIMVTQRLHFLQISEKLNVPVEQLQALNPQYKKGIIPGNKEKPYSLRLPAATAVEFAGIEKEIYGYKDSLFFDSNFALSTPQLKKGKNGKYTTAQYVAPSEKGKTKISYTVKEGDTYGFIASWYDVRVSDLKYWNDAYSNRLSVGQNITVLVPSGKASKYANINTMTFDQKQAAEGKSLVAETVAVSFSSNRPTDSNYVWYKIQQGDNLWTISQKYPGTSDQDIKAINGFSTKDLRKLQAGMYIKIKRK